MIRVPNHSLYNHKNNNKIQLQLIMYKYILSKFCSTAWAITYPIVSKSSFPIHAETNSNFDCKRPWFGAFKLMRASKWFRRHINRYSPSAPHKAATISARNTHEFPRRSAISSPGELRFQTVTDNIQKLGGGGTQDRMDCVSDEI